MRTMGLVLTYLKKKHWDGAQKNNSTEAESLEETYFNLEALPAFFWQLKEAISPP